MGAGNWAREKQQKFVLEQGVPTVRPTITLAF